MLLQELERNASPGNGQQIWWGSSGVQSGANEETRHHIDSIGK
jgi:hypothetical protein